MTLHNMIELERTFLVSSVPFDVTTTSYKEMFDQYMPTNDPHPSLRLRQNGNRYEITKKQPITEGDSSQFTEETVHVTHDEFIALSAAPSLDVRKYRYEYKQDDLVFEFDVFQDNLSGLVLMDVEFENEEQMKNFVKPDYCLAEVTHEEFTAGGMLAGKSFADIQNQLEQFNYKLL